MNTDRRGSSLTPAGIVEWLLHIRSWKQAAITLVFTIAGLLTLIVYNNQERFVAAFEELVREPPRVRIHETQIPEITAQLLRILPGRPRSVVAWGVNTEINRRRLLGYAADGEVKAVLDAEFGDDLRRAYPFMRDAPEANHLIIIAMYGHVACGPPKGTVSELQLYAQFNVGTLCVVAIPPECGQIVGMLTVTFADVLTPEQRESAHELLWNAAEQLTRR